MKHRKVTSAIANRMLMLKKEGYTHKYIAKDVGLSDGYISDLFRQRFLLEQMQEKLNTANQSHPGHWPCMIPKEIGPGVCMESIATCQTAVGLGKFKSQRRTVMWRLTVIQFLTMLTGFGRSPHNVL